MAESNDSGGAPPGADQAHEKKSVSIPPANCQIEEIVPLGNCTTKYDVTWKTFPTMDLPDGSTTVTEVFVKLAVHSPFT